MKSKALFISLLLSWIAVITPVSAQSELDKYTGTFYNKNERIYLHLNLTDATLTVPGMDFLGKVNGYIHGNIYGIWMLTKFKKEKKGVVLRFSNDMGSDSQEIRLVAINDSTLHYNAVGGNCIKRVVKRKLVKIPDELVFTKR